MSGGGRTSRGLFHKKIEPISANYMENDEVIKKLRTPLHALAIEVMLLVGRYWG